LKELWVQIDKNAKEKEKLFQLAAEKSDALVVGHGATLKSGHEQVDLITSFDENVIKQLKNAGKSLAVRITINSKEDENIAVEASDLSVNYIIINCSDWRVIPLENLIAKVRGKSKLLAEVKNSEDARLVLEALELGTDGVLLITEDVEELRRTSEVVRRQNPNVSLTLAKITSVRPIGTGARVCVDTCDLMQPGEGMLVGSQSAGLFLVEAEVHDNPYVASRPFRVNAGTLSMYTLGSAQNTRYLSELRAGDEVLIIDRNGKVRTTNVGRIKIEFRPLILVEAEIGDKKIKIVLQNAETIRLVTPNGSSPVTALKKGDEVLVHQEAKGGRHFGVSVPEKVIEQ
jgi:3-dehydroquinate synthase II